jgi:2-(1,2-epoxy-1,2-dihydrophenyl)acetyl-CoA isomerase
MNFDHIKVERAGALLWLTLNRPNEANALSIPLAEEFHAAIREAEADPGCHILILQGSGKFFCAGGDVVGMAGSNDPAEFLRILVGKMHTGILALARSSLVTIAAVHGPAAGAGLGLVLNADFVVASPQASFLSAYAGIGLTPDCGVSYLLPQMIGPRRAAEVCLAGRAVSAQEALDWGLVNELVEEPELQARVQEVAEKLSGGASQILGPTKRLLNAERLSAYAAHLDDEARTIASIVSNADAQNRIAAFAERSRSRSRD